MEQTRYLKYHTKYSTYGQDPWGSWACRTRVYLRRGLASQVICQSLTAWRSVSAAGSTGSKLWCRKMRETPIKLLYISIKIPILIKVREGVYKK